MRDALSEQSGIVGHLEALVAAAMAAAPGDAPPPVAWLQVETRGRVRDLLLGWRTDITGPVTLLDWQSSPLASVFFSTPEGDDYEIEVDGRTLDGTVRGRALLEVERGVLVGVVTASAVLSRDGDGWRRVGDPPAPLLRPRPAGASRAPSPFTLDALDAEQRRAVGLPRRRALLALGEAGCGKTTVALFRIAALQARAEQGGRSFRGLVLVPVEGLQRLSTTLLARLGAKGVEVKSYERWAAVQARRAFPGLPRRESQAAPAAVTRLKRHPALREALADVAARPGRPRGATATREDLQHLFGDRVLMERVARASAGAVSPHAVGRVLEHTNVQFTDTTEASHRHVDADRLATVDGLRIDAGTPFEDAGAVDPEDYAVLFALAALRATPGDAAPSPGAYDCVVLDEAQEFAPIELALIGRALRPGGALVVAGDEGQQVDDTAYFPGWDEAMRELGAGSFEAVRLAVSYRCPPAVTALARAVLRGEGSVAPDGAAVVAWRGRTVFHVVAALVDAVRALREADPEASVAVVCRTAESAARTAALLARGEDGVRLVRGGDFSFAAGVEVTCVQEVKGLEFDHVVVPDCDAGAYPEGHEGRRALYVAMTRASHQLVLTTAATWAPALRGALQPPG
ncbi:MAG: ATP-binding domain-containing protein [Deltaproteobacteria bacterium]|nr:ATP-binding domain-containing protein [Myxococcales bacterium]MDP3213259.1 ATP-binding domain-containing protein [Deltaproteobacteria bacterium]